MHFFATGILMRCFVLFLNQDMPLHKARAGARNDSTSRIIASSSSLGWQACLDFAIPVSMDENRKQQGQRNELALYTKKLPSPLHIHEALFWQSARIFAGPDEMRWSPIFPSAVSGSSLLSGTFRGCSQACMRLFIIPWTSAAGRMSIESAS